MRGKEEISEAKSPDIERGEVAPTNEKSERLEKIYSTAHSKRWRHQSIYRIPRNMKKDRSGAYEPQTVSLGPYHHGAEHLQGKEEDKQRALRTFLKRSNKPRKCYVEALAPVVEDLRDAYNQLDDKWKHDDEAFLQLMIVDGCFILEIMRTTTAEPESLARMGYARNDPVFSYHGQRRFAPDIMRDMLMLENQIPLPTLVSLLAAEDDSDGLSKQDQPSLSELILKFFQPADTDVPLQLIGDIEELQSEDKCLHILELYHRSMLLRLPRQRPAGRRLGCFDSVRRKRIPPATELAQAGIRFKQSNTGRFDGNSSFRRGVLKLPQIVVDHALESWYLNMIAFERLYADADAELTSFVVFMSNVIQSARDVELLRSCGVIDNASPSPSPSSEADQGVAELFKSLSRDATVDPVSKAAFVINDVGKHCERLLPRCRICYNRVYAYVTTNWVSLSVLAAVSLFLLTALQAFYAVLAYYHPKN